MKILPALFAAAVLATAHAAVPSMGSSAILLGNASVQKELHLTSLQKAVLHDIRNDFRDDCRAVTAKVAAGKETKAQGLADLQALTASSERRAMHALNDDQKARLAEIRVQILGGYLLFSPAIQAKLGLSDAQKATIAKIEQKSDASVAKINAAFEQGKTSYYQRIISLRKSRIKFGDEAVDVLTSEQYDRFTELEGEDFEIES